MVKDEEYYEEPDPANPHGFGVFNPADRVGMYEPKDINTSYPSRFHLRPARSGKGRTPHNKFWNSHEVYIEPDQANPYGIPRPPIEE